MYMNKSNATSNFIIHSLMLENNSTKYGYGYEPNLLTY